MYTYTCIYTLTLTHSDTLLWQISGFRFSIYISSDSPFNITHDSLPISTSKDQSELRVDPYHSVQLHLSISIAILNVKVGHIHNSATFLWPFHSIPIHSPPFSPLNPYTRKNVVLKNAMVVNSLYSHCKIRL